MEEQNSNKRKKNKVKQQVKIGEASYINPKTNELEKFNVFEQSRETDFNFHKVWVQDLVEVLGLIGGPKVKVFNHILSNMNGDNIFFGTIRNMATSIGISKETVSSSLKLLKKAGQIKMLQDGVYMINPDLILKGKSAKRQRLQAIFYDLTYKQKTIKTRASKEEADFSNLKKAYEEKEFNKMRTEMMFQEANEYYKGSNPE